MKLMTWNMQGGGVSGHQGAKWEALADFLLDEQDPPSVIDLQETGGLPQNFPTEYEEFEPVATGGWQTERFTWTIEDNDDSYTYHVAWVNLDTNSGRVNIALVTEDEPDEYCITYAERRPALGVRLGDIWYFTIHANAAHGCDAEDILANIWTAVDADAEWIALGDFNRPPDQILMNGETLSQVTNERNLSLIYNDSGDDDEDYTHPRPGSNSESPEQILDYAAKTGDIADYDCYRKDMDYSDHYAVVFTEQEYEEEAVDDGEGEEDL